MRNVVNVPRNSWWAQATQNRLIALVLAMIVIVPFIAVPADFRLGGVAALVMQGFALVLATALLWRARLSFSREQITTFLRTGPNTPVLLLMGLIAASCALASNKFYGIQEALRWGAGMMLFFVVAYQFRQSKHLFLLVDAILFLGIATSILSFGQYALEPQLRGTILFGNQQLLGSFLMILLPIVAVVALTDRASQEQTSKRQLVAQFATIMMAGSLLLAHTRSAWIGALVGMAVLGALMLATSRKTGDLRAQKHKLVLPAILGLSAIAFAVLAGAQNNGVVDRASTLSNIAAIPNWQGRQQQWQGTREMIQASPVFGHGIGQSPLLQKEYSGIGATLSSNGFAAGPRNSLTEQAHNFYLQTAAEIGLVGLALMVAVLATFMVAGIGRVRQMDAGIRRSLLMASMAGVSAFAVDAISSPSWQLGQVSIFFWLVLGIGVSCLRPRSKQVEEVAPTMVARRVVRPLSAIGAALAIMFIVLPTASVSVRAQYGDDDDEDESDNSTEDVAKIVGAVAVVAAVVGGLGAGAAGAGAAGAGGTGGTGGTGGDGGTGGGTE